MALLVDMEQLVDMVSFQEFDTALLVDMVLPVGMEQLVDMVSCQNMETVQELCAE